MKKILLNLLLIATLFPVTGAEKEEIQTLLFKEPEPGLIVKSEPYHFDNSTLYTLSNGIRVVTLLNPAVKDQIYIRGIGEGGLSQSYIPELAPTMKMLNDIVSVSHFGDYSGADLKDIFKDRKVNVTIDLKNTEEVIEASTNSEGLEDAFRVIYLKATDLRPDKDAFEIWREKQKRRYTATATNPVWMMADSIHRNVYNRHPLGNKENLEMVMALDYEQALDLARDRFSDMSDFTFFITGDFDQNNLENLLSRYVASLPCGGRMEKPKDIGYRFTPATEEISFSTEMSKPVGIVYYFYHGPAEYTLENYLAINLFHSILQNRILKELKEDKGWLKKIDGHGAIVAGMNGEDSPELMMPIYIRADAGHEQEISDFVDASVTDMLINGVMEEELEEAKKDMADYHVKHERDNAYLLSILRVYDHYGLDMHTPYLEILSSLKDINRYVASLSTYRSRLIMQPE